MSTTETLTFDVPTAIKTALSVTPQVAAAPAQWQTVTVSALTDVERLLDRAEQEGHCEHELTVLGSAVFVVRWR